MGEDIHCFNSCVFMEDIHCESCLYLELYCLHESLEICLCETIVSGKIYIVRVVCSEDIHCFNSCVPFVCMEDIQCESCLYLKLELHCLDESLEIYIVRVLCPSRYTLLELFVWEDIHCFNYSVPFVCMGIYSL